MKKFLSTLCMVTSLAATAQHVSQTQGYNYSVFDTYTKLPMNGQAMAATQARMVELLPGFHATTDKLTGMARDIYGKAMQVPGKTTEEKANYVINNKLGNFGINAPEWQKTNAVDIEHASYAYFEQYIDGHKVAFSQLSLRFTPDGKLQRVVAKQYGHPDAGLTPTISNADAYNLQPMKEGLAGISVSEKTIEQDWYWFPIPTVNKYVMHPAWRFVITGTENKTNMPVELTGYIDAVTGELLYRMNDVKEEVNLVVKGNVYKDGFLVAASDEPLANLQITIGSNSANTNDTGLYKNTSLNPTQNATVALRGLWSIVRNTNGSGTIPSFTKSITVNGTTYIFPATSPSSEQAVNAYYHVNRVHEHIKALTPSGFTGIDIALPTIVDRTSTTGCNAYYSSNTINFYTENSSCNSFAKVGDIIYHEYGHFTNAKYYAFIKGSGGMSNGGLNEGYADVWAMGITKDPVLGKGAFKAGGNIRTYGPTGTTKVYPMNRTSEVHANGEIIAGAWWDLGVNLGSVDSMTKLFVKHLSDVPDGPEGTEGEVYHEALVAAIINDDDDANLNNGTPHFNEIVSAFAKHGIYLFSDAALVHNDVLHTQTESQEKAIEAEIKISEPAYFNTMKLIYRNTVNPTWDTLAMTNAGAGASGGIKFTVNIPGQASGSVVEHYFITFDVNGNGAYSFPMGYNPNGDLSQITLPYQYATGVYWKTGTDFESDPFDWTLEGKVPGDNATGGNWTAAKPVPSYWKPNSSLSFMVQTDKDHTTGSGKCLITGNAAAASTAYDNADVDAGKTTAQSPIYDISSYRNPIVEYYRWYSSEWGPRDSNPRTDAWSVQIRDPNTPFWQNIENTYQSDEAWRRKLIKVKDYLPNSTQVQLRFIATDATNTSLTGNGQNVVEGAIDDLTLFDTWATSVSQLGNESGISVFPNPANSTLNIKLSASMTGTIVINDMTGREVIRQSVDAGVTNYSINTSSLASGAYMVVINTNQTVVTKKITIAH